MIVPTAAKMDGLSRKSMPESSSSALPSLSSERGFAMEGWFFPTRNSEQKRHFTATDFIISPQNGHGFVLLELLVGIWISGFKPLKGPLFHLS